MAFAIVGKDERVAGVDETGFRDEREIEDLVSLSLSEIFPCLKQLTNQFSVMMPGDVGMDKDHNYIIDTLAFDSEKKCFVVIEYKNKIDNGVIGQVLGYVEMIVKNKANCMHVNRDSGMTLEDYDWDAGYAIIISPAHSSKQTVAVSTLLKLDDNLIKMYEIRKFANFIVTLDRIQGNPVCADNLLNDHSRINDSGIFNGEMLLKKFEQEINNIGHVLRKDLQGRVAIKTSTGKNICIIKVQAKRLKLYYGTRKRHNVLHKDNFVLYDEKAPRQFGAGEYWSVITDSDDIKRSIKILKTVYEFLTSSEESHSLQDNAKLDVKYSGDKLHDAFESMIHGIGRLKREDMHRYTVYRTLEKMNVCTIIEQANRLKLYYAPRDHNHVLHKDSFVVYDTRGRLHGAGDYMSIINNLDDIDKAIEPLKKTYDWRMNQSNFTTNPSNNKKELLEKFEQMIRGIEHVQRKELKGRIAYKTFKGNNICVIMKLQKRFKLYYGIRRRHGLLHEDDFIKYDEKAPRKFGTGEYWCFINNFDEVDKAIKLFKKVNKFLVTTKNLGPRFPSPYSLPSKRKR